MHTTAASFRWLLYRTDEMFHEGTSAIDLIGDISGTTTYVISDRVSFLDSIQLFSSVQRAGGLSNSCGSTDCQTNSTGKSIGGSFAGQKTSSRPRLWYAQILPACFFCPLEIIMIVCTYMVDCRLKFAIASCSLFLQRGMEGVALVFGWRSRHS